MGKHFLINKNLFYWKFENSKMESNPGKAREPGFPAATPMAGCYLTECSGSTVFGEQQRPHRDLVNVCRETSVAA